MSFHKQCWVVSCGIGQWYPRGIDRLQRALYDVMWHGNSLIYKDTYPPGCPLIESAGYAFKPYALLEAVKQGARYILWCDASVWPIKPILPVFQKIQEDGHLFFNNGYSVGQWCRDSSLAPLGLTREESMRMPEVTTSFFGLDVGRPASIEFLNQWMRYANDGETFKVHPRDNRNGECSSDNRVLGHRYDQTAGSVIFNRLGMKMIEMPYMYAYYQKRTDESIFVNMGL